MKGSPPASLDSANFLNYIFPRWRLNHVKDFLTFILIWVGISFLCYCNPEVFWTFEPTNYVAFSTLATCLCCSLNPSVLFHKGRRSALVTIILASTILGIAASVCYVQRSPGDAEWRTRENIETGRFYTPGMFEYPDSSPAQISRDLRLEEEIKYANDVLFLSELYFWKACLNYAPPFLLGSWLYGMFIFALTQKKILRLQPRLAAKV